MSSIEQIRKTLAIINIINELKISVCIKKFDDIIKSARYEVGKEDELYSFDFLFKK